VRDNTLTGSIMIFTLKSTNRHRWLHFVGLVLRGWLYVPWEQISSLIILVSTWLENTPKIENTGSTSWKPLRSSSGHALDDDDES